MGKERKTGKLVERNKARDHEGGKAEGGRASRGQDCIAVIKVSASVSSLGKDSLRMEGRNSFSNDLRKTDTMQTANCAFLKCLCSH